MRVPEGFSLSAVKSGVKKNKLDLGLICGEDFLAGCGFFTLNANPSYSVQVSKKHILYPIKAVLVNSGNANCFWGESGLRETEEVCRALANFLGVKKENILIASTGVIGKRLPKEKIINSLGGLIKNLGKNIADFATSILTTDTVRKISYAQIPLKNKKVNILGFAKGAGMIYPNMATMLSFVLSEAYFTPSLFKKVCVQALEESFNSISVDGCTSTNDTFLVLSSQRVILKEEKDILDFSRGLKRVCLDLAQMIVRDAEGASKFIRIFIKGASSLTEAKRAGFLLANSNLLKCALYGANPNWGRIVAALGQGGIQLKEKGQIKFSSFKAKEVRIEIDLRKGRFSTTVYTSDLTPAYIRINAEYG